MNYIEMKEGLGGFKIATRRAWNDINTFVYLVPGSMFVVNRLPLLGVFPDGTQITYRPHIDMHFSDGTCGTWERTVEDVLACDWEILE